MSDEPEFDCIACLQHAEDAAEENYLGWSGVCDYYREFRGQCSHHA